ncbi:MAG: hypothetical protein KF799_12915 [Bdellovibrionales bacterium]|nr:hypothetical protein [Bdellovibrionales bacterium]
MFALILLLGLVPPAHAETVLVPAPASVKREYEARLAASSFASPSQVYKRQHPSAEGREHLLSSYADAQKAFLQNSLTEAIVRFESVVNRLPSEDWSRSDRELILLSCLRLAQIDSVRRDQWLTKALLLGPGLDIDEQLFPPPLVAQLKRLRAEVPSVQPRRLVDFNEWTLVLINGVSCSPSACPEFSDLPLTVRVTFVSDRWLPQTLHLPLSDLGKAQPERLAWLEGACGAPRFHPKTETLGTKLAFWGLNCDGVNPIVPLAPTPTLALPENVKPAATPFYKNKWVWAGLGLITAALVISQQQQRDSVKEERQTSTTYGF